MSTVVGSDSSSHVGDNPRGRRYDGTSIKELREIIRASFLRVELFIIPHKCEQVI